MKSIEQFLQIMAAIIIGAAMILGLHNLEKQHELEKSIPNRTQNRHIESFETITSRHIAQLSAEKRVKHDQR